MPRTFSPFSFYELTTKHIYAGGALLASLDTRLGSTTTFHVHPDHLGSTHIVTTSTGGLDQVLAYYPFGSPRIQRQYGSLNQRNRYVGQEYDEETQLNYLQQRYQNAVNGQFVSLDSVFLGNANTWDLKDPQNFNSYSYAKNNPITLKDPDGKQYIQALGALATALTRLRALVGLLGVTAASNQEISRSVSKSVADAVDSISQSLRNYSTSPVSAPTKQVTTNTNLMNIKFGIQSSVVIGSPSAVSTPYTTVSLSGGKDTISFSWDGASQGMSKPNNVPSGTKPIDQVGLTKDQVHQIKDIVGAGPQDWVGQAPNGDIITGTPTGEAENHGPIKPYD